MAKQGVKLPPAGAVRRRHGVPAARAGLAPAPASTRSSAPSRTRARCCSAGATCRSTTRDLAEPAKNARAGDPAGVRRPRPRRHGHRRASSASSTSSGRAPGTPSRRSSCAHGKEFYVPSMSARTMIYKGMLLANQIGEYYPRPEGRARRVGAGARAPALLHQHLPVLGPGAAVPHDRAQRRDQHAARQRQLDARAPERACPARCSART